MSGRVLGSGAALHEAAREVAQELPASTMGHPFGPEYEVYKVRGRVFLLLTDVPGEPIAIVKADPQDAQALRQEHEHITPGYHMNKRHWITLAPGASVDAGLVHELVTESYCLVVAGLPRAVRPVDPVTFGAVGR